MKIPIEICNRILLVGVNFKRNPGGMSSVIQYYEPYFERLRYVATYYYTGRISRVVFFFMAITKIFLLLLLDRKLKIVHIHSAADGSFVRASVVLRLCKVFRKKVILHCHASRFKDFYSESEQKRKILNILNGADVLVVLSNSWKKWFKSIGVDEKRIEILNNITAYPQLFEKRKQDSKLHLLFLGLLGERKGIFDVIKSLGEHKDKFCKALILKIGGNTHEGELMDVINKYGIGDFVKFEGWVSGEKKIELLNWADAYILPSYNEGLPIGILEAMSYGCAIIASPVGGIPEVVKDGINGIIVEPGNINEIVDAILRLLDQQELKKMSDESKNIVTDYLPDSVIGELLTLYKSLLD